MTEGDDDGFLWRLNTYWSFLEVPGGLLIECEAISLTRDVPAGLGWLVAPVIQDMPRESLKFTLTATRNASGLKRPQGSTPMSQECEVHMREAMIADRRQTGFVNPAPSPQSADRRRRKARASLDGLSALRRRSTPTI